MHLWQKLALVAVAGGVGALARVGLSSAVQKVAGGAFPWGTASVNVLGCFLFGFVWAVSESWAEVGPDARLIVLGGFMGAFTTFSTYVFDLDALARGGQWGALAGNLVLQNAVGFAALFAAIALGRALT